MHKIRILYKLYIGKKGVVDRKKSSKLIQQRVVALEKKKWRARNRCRSGWNKARIYGGKANEYWIKPNPITPVGLQTRSSRTEHSPKMCKLRQRGEKRRMEVLGSRARSRRRVRIFRCVQPDRSLHSCQVYRVTDLVLHRSAIMEPMFPRILLIGVKFFLFEFLSLEYWPISLVKYYNDWFK